MANVRPALVLVCTWLMPGNTYSTGSSTVVTFLPVELISSRVAYSVVVLPAPVGPAQMTMPNGAWTSLEYVLYVSAGIPSWPRLTIDFDLSSRRMTIFSPNTVATDDTRTSIWRPSTLVEN